MSTITKIKTVYCSTCAKEHLQNTIQSQVRQILYAEGRGGSRIAIVRVCPHLTVEETFDIENEPQDQESASPS